jgi:hypothetical protein
MKLHALYEDADFSPTSAIPVTTAEFKERASGVNTPAMPGVPQPNSDRSGNQGAVARPAVRLGDNPGTTQASVQRFMNAGPAPRGGKTIIGQAPRIMAKRDEPVTP